MYKFIIDCKLLEMTKNQVEAYLDEFSKVFEGSNCS